MLICAEFKFVERANESLNDLIDNVCFFLTHAICLYVCACLLSFHSLHLSRIRFGVSRSSLYKLQLKIEFDTLFTNWPPNKIDMYLVAHVNI